LCVIIANKDNISVGEYCPQKNHKNISTTPKKSLYLQRHLQKSLLQNKQ